MELAERVGGEIVDADSMQIYRDLRVVTARPSAEDEARVAHHLYGVVDGAEAWSVGRWLRAAEPVLRAIASQGRPAIVTGGTGLYFAALTQGLADVPAVPDEIRDAAAAEFDAGGEAAFRMRLREADPQAEARVAPGDRQRLVRALAVARATGRPLSAWREETRPLLRPDVWRAAVLEPPRDVLYARADRRARRMLDDGALEEVAALRARGLPPTLPVMKALGVEAFGRALDGACTPAEAAEETAGQTRRYAKRQTTWFRNQTPEWPRAADGDGAVRLLLDRE